VNADLREAETAVAAALADPLGSAAEGGVPVTSISAGYLSASELVVSARLAAVTDEARARAALILIPGAVRTDRAGTDDVFVRVYLPRQVTR
jgi:hypothetical protein